MIENNLVLLVREKTLLIMLQAYNLGGRGLASRKAFDNDRQLIPVNILLIITTKSSKIVK